MKRQKFKISGFLLYGFLGCIFAQSGPTLDWQFDPYSTDQWFKQKLDHYDSGNIQNWPQRYVTSYQFYRLGGPVFLYLSGPGPELTLTDIETGAIAEYAEQQGAFVIGLEHRFYGKSRPTSDLSTENLHFLTIPQTIEDIASFIRSWRSRDEFRNSKWVVFGVSYLGSLAAWFAQKHPELIDAFVASSAPLELRYEIPEFLENVGSTINETNPKCYDTVAEGFSCLTKIFNEEDCHGYTLADVKDKFNFCADLDRGRPLDATGVFAELFSTINGVVMYHDPSPDSFPDTNLDRFCKYLASEKDSRPAIDKIGDKVKEINKHRGVPCAEFRFQTTVDFLRAKEWDSDAAKEGYRQLQWQLCNELGWTVASANISQPFGNYLTPFLHSEICQNLFGLTETEMRLKVLKANTDLKGKGLNTKCGIFVNGNKDPWHTFSITKAEEAGSCNKAILIDGGSHGRDIEDFSNKPSYPPEVRRTQLKISEYLDRWLKTGNCCEEPPAAESQRVISFLSRPTRTTSNNYFTSSSLPKQPNVNIRPHAYPVDTTDKLIASPTSIPYQVSTTDVLSVSPRIPVDLESHSADGTPKADMSTYRDPRNAELRRYRVVKLLRHRPSFIPTTPEPSMAPSMEQFEADFPEHSIRVEGRVEKIFKNGTAIPTVPPSSEVNEQISLFDKGRRVIEDAMTPENHVIDGKNNKSKETGSMDGWHRKPHFRYVIKQVFKDVVGLETANNTKDKQQSESDADALLESNESSDSSEDEDLHKEVSNSPKKAAKREHSLEETDVYHSLVPSEEEEQSRRESNEENGNRSVAAHDEKHEKEEEVKIEQEKSSGESRENDPLSESESNEQESILPSHSGKTNNKSKEMITTTTPKPKSTQHKEKKVDESEEEDYEDDYDDDSDYYDDDEDDESEEDNESPKETESSGNEQPEKAKNNKTNKPTSKPKATIGPIEESKNSSDFDSGEDSKPRRLREKISEKIMSSSEDIEGDEKSAEKATKVNRHRHKGQKAETEANKSSDEAESVENRQTSSRSKPEAFSDEDYNYSLEPSGSDPKGIYKKKKMASPHKPILDDPTTVINVEISGSYPNRKFPLRKSKKTSEAPSTKANSDETRVEIETPKRIRKTHKRIKVEVNEKLESNQGNRTVVRRKKVKKPKTTTTTTTTSTTTTTTTLPPDTTSKPILLLPLPPTNSYPNWNEERRKGEAEAVQIQQQVPDVVSLNNGDNSGSMYLPPNPSSLPVPPPQNSNDVVYIIIGDIPRLDNPNLINNNPSKEDLFNFIQQLVSRHTPSVSAQHSYSPNLVSYNPTTNAPPTTTTTTTPAPPVHFQHRYLDASGKYLLLPVPLQVVPLPTGYSTQQDLLNNSAVTPPVETRAPVNQYQYQTQARHDYRRQNVDPVGGYRFKSPLHRDHFERLLSVDAQVRDSDRGSGSSRHSVRRLDQIPDQSWRSIRGVSQFGPVPSPNNGGGSNLLSLSLADTMWVNEGVPFLPSRSRLSRRSTQYA